MLSLVHALLDKPLPPGTPAPAFSMLDQHGHSQQVGTFRGGKLLLVFFQHYNNRECLTYLTQLRDQYPQLQSEGWSVLAVNPLDWEALHNMATQLNLPFPVLFDPLSKYANQYNAALLRSFLNRKLIYAIDENGKVMWSHQGYKLPL